MGAGRPRTDGLRVGVDVGGTFTKAVAVRPRSCELVGAAAVPTTHDAPEGVAGGVIEALQALLRLHHIPVEAISLVAHSTTQAVNALLEGDVVTVGIVGMGGGRDAAEAARRTRIGRVELAPGRFLKACHVFVDTTRGLTPEQAERAVRHLLRAGAEAVVASEAFGVDDPRHEQLVGETAARLGVPAVAGHQISGVYGLEVRTITAAVNAALLPKMWEMADRVERSLRAMGIEAPLMVMRGDGGLTDLDTLRRRPLLTLFSGPAASLAGALLAGRVVNGVFLEVGGTSTNIGIVRHGSPVMRYVQVMGRPTCVRSLDVRVHGVAGGSLVRTDGRKLVGVGPRSAHIAGLPYVCFSPDLPSAEELYLETVAPRPGDPDDYVVVRSRDGRYWGLTVTCAANALGLVPDGAYARGSAEAARVGFALLGRTWRCSVEEAARRVLDWAADRVARAVGHLAKEHRLGSGFVLVGGGGGAGALVPAVARRLGVPYRLVDHAEVISSVGDALACVREVVERPLSAVAHAAAVVEEAERAAVGSGALPGSVRVVVERDEERGVLRAIATGHVALAPPAPEHVPEEHEARRAAAEAAGADSNVLTLLADAGGFRVYRVPRRLWRPSLVAVVDPRGEVRLFSGRVKVVTGTPVEVWRQVRQLVPEKPTPWSTIPAVRLLLGGRFLDLTAISCPDDLFAAAREVLKRAALETVVAIVGG